MPEKFQYVTIIYINSSFITISTINTITSKMAVYYLLIYHTCSYQSNPLWPSLAVAHTRFNTILCEEHTGHEHCKGLPGSPQFFRVGKTNTQNVRNKTDLE